MHLFSFAQLGQAAVANICFVVPGAVDDVDHTAAFLFLRESRVVRLSFPTNLCLSLHRS